MLLQLDQTDNPAVSAAFEEQMTNLPSFTFEVGKVKPLQPLIAEDYFVQKGLIAKAMFQSCILFVAKINW